MWVSGVYIFYNFMGLLPGIIWEHELYLEI